MTIGDRVKILRKKLDLTQASFAEKIGLKATAIGLYESGSRTVTERSIVTICQTFNVNEEWLRTGKGEMLKKNDDVEIAHLAREFSLSDLGKAVIKGYSGLNDYEKGVIGRCIKSIAAEYQKAEKSKKEKPQGNNDTDELDPDIKKELDSNKSQTNDIQNAKIETEQYGSSKPHQLTDEEIKEIDAECEKYRHELEAEAFPADTDSSQKKA
ncbi:MAG: helix-turn-helix transcriptional regulator [Oscillospiraceae bacterium]|nr:helix-turn-helix transcriptional regulator [Oscillospiraceae bacterium]